MPNLDGWAYGPIDINELFYVLVTKYETIYNIQDHLWDLSMKKV